MKHCVLNDRSISLVGDNKDGGRGNDRQLHQAASSEWQKFALLYIFIVHLGYLAPGQLHDIFQGTRRSENNLETVVLVYHDGADDRAPHSARFQQCNVVPAGQHLRCNIF